MTSENIKRKRIIKIVCCVLAGVFLLLSIAVIVLSQSRRLFEGEINNDKAYMSVMSDVEKITEADPRVVDLAMLASHNANTYALDNFNGLSGEVDKGMSALYRTAWGLMYRYIKNQVSNIYDQLCQGARFLQFRCSYQDGELYGSHTVIDRPIRTYIEDVLRFLQNATGEIVVLDLRIRYFDDRTVADAARELFDISYDGHTLKDYIPYEYVSSGDLTYNTVTRNGKSSGAVVLFDLISSHGTKDWFDQTLEYDGKFYVTSYMRWVNFDIITDVGHNRMSEAAISEYNDGMYDWIASDFELHKNNFRILQVQSTPSVNDPLETFGAWSLACYAKRHNAAMLEHPNFDKWMKFMPIVLFDFVTTSGGDFNRKINEKISAYNRDLVQKLLSTSA